MCGSTSLHPSKTGVPFKDPTSLRTNPGGPINPPLSPTTPPYRFAWRATYSKPRHAPCEPHDQSTIGSDSLHGKRSEEALEHTQRGTQGRFISGR